MRNQDGKNSREGGTAGHTPRCVSRPVPLPRSANLGHFGTMSRPVPLCPVVIRGKQGGNRLLPPPLWLLSLVALNPHQEAV